MKNILFVANVKKDKDTIYSKGYCFEILKVENRIIREVKISKNYVPELEAEGISLRD